ncbi:EpsG family protein [Vibrio fluvialis]|nr:EpsG family protein [Vibrio fluvialis]
MRELFVFIWPLIMYFCFIFLYANKNIHLSYTLSTVLILIISVFISSRGEEAGYDTVVYANTIQTLSESGWLDLSQFIKNQIGAGYEPVFWYISKLAYTIYPSVEFVFFVICSFSSFILMIGMRKLESESAKVMVGIIFLIFITSGSYYSLMSNTIRQGLSVSFFVLALGLYSQQKVYSALFWLCCAFFSHFSSIPLYIITLIFIRVRLSVNFYFLAVFFSLLLYLLGVPNKILAAFIPAYGTVNANYLFHPAYLSSLFFLMSIQWMKKFNIPKLPSISRVYLGILSVQTLFLSNANSFNRVGFIRFIIEPILIYYFLLNIKSRFSVSIVSILYVIYQFFVFGSDSILFNLGLS